jgi:hypothetical protein
MLKRLALGAVAAWAAWGFLVEMEQAMAQWDHRELFAGISGWRFHTAQTDALARSLGAARRVIPPGAVVAFTTPDDPPGTEFLAWRWTAYLMPENDVVPVNDPAAGQAARYALGFRREIHHPRTEPLLRLPDGWLYRVKQP